MHMFLTVFLFDYLTTLANSALVSEPWWQMQDIVSSAGIPKGIKLPPPNPSAKCVVIDETVGVDNGAENAFWYFREDLGINFQHFWYHLTNPTFRNETPIDRGGELFFYFHRNIIARFEAERLSNGFPRLVALNYSIGAIIEDGYNPNLDPHDTLIMYVKRPPRLKYVNHRYPARALDALQEDVKRGRLIALNGSFIPITTDRLGNAIEASTENVNGHRYLFDGIHSAGHKTIGIVGTDFMTTAGVMLITSASMRDPVFYRFHLLLDDIFYQHQKMLEPHHPTEGEFPLTWDGVSVGAVSVGRGTSEPKNTLKTYFENLNISMPLLQDLFLANKMVNYCVKRLEHEEFSYNITLTREPFVTSDKATVRIFMSPRFNESGSRFDMSTQHRLFFAMDHFTTSIPVGTSVVTRSSKESSLLGHWRLEKWMENAPSVDNSECGCGWPAHLLLPRGTSEGMAFDLFVMVTDAKIDLPSGENAFKSAESVCQYGHILCGVKGKIYPDLKPMDYPFDTLPFKITGEKGLKRPVKDLDEYVREIPNAAYTQVVICHEKS